MDNNFIYHPREEKKGGPHHWTQLTSIFVGRIEPSLDLVRRCLCVKAGAARRAAVTARRESRRATRARSPVEAAPEVRVPAPRRRVGGAQRRVRVLGPGYFLSTFSSFSFLMR